MVEDIDEYQTVPGVIILVLRKHFQKPVNVVTKGDV